MKIEITKKMLFIALISVSVIVLSISAGYIIGVNSHNKPMGKGGDYYLEFKPAISDAANQTLVYHSTIDCPEIRYGVRMNSYGWWYEYNHSEIYPYYFCSKCMDSKLINECETKIITQFRENQKE